MEPVSFLIGIIAGGCVASAIWVIANVIIGNKGKAERTRRNSVISSIGEHIAETDSLRISFSAGAISGERLKGQIIKNIEAIQSLYKPNLYLFDVFYTKYIDALLTRYTEYVKNVTPMVKQPTASVDHFAEAAAVAIEQPPVIVKQKVVTPSPVPAAVKNVSTEESVEVASAVAIAPAAIAPAAIAPAAIAPATIEPVAIEPVAIEPVAIEPVAIEPVAIEPVTIEPVTIEPVVEEEKEVGEALFSSKTEPAKVESDSRKGEFSIEPMTFEPVATEHFEVLPVDDADIPDVQSEVQDSTRIEDLQKEESEEIAAVSMPEEQEAEISFEAMAQDVMSVEDEEEGARTSFPPAMNHNVETQTQLIHGLVPPNSDEEEFSMETIMDLDMSKIPAFSQEKSNITIKTQSSKPVEIDHPLQDTRKIYPQSVPVGNNLETSQTEPVLFENHDHHQAEKDNYGITGDDVADQMDSFFGIGK